MEEFDLSDNTLSQAYDEFEDHMYLVETLQQFEG